MIEELFGLSGRTAIVTGSSTGLGQGISLALSGAGANVVGVDYVKSTDTAKIIGERGGAFTEVVADLMTTAPIDGIIEKAVQTYGGLDILVNNAGGPQSYASLQHSAWNGLTPCDLVFPFFLFICFTGMPVMTDTVRMISLSVTTALRRPALSLRRSVAADFAVLSVMSNSFSFLMSMTGMPSSEGHHALISTRYLIVAALSL